MVGNLIEAINIVTTKPNQEKTSIYDAIWTSLLKNPTGQAEIIIGHLADNALSNPNDRLDQFARYLAGLVRFYLDHPDFLLKLVDKEKKTKVNSELNDSKINTILERLNFIIDKAIGKANQNQSMTPEEIRQLKKVSEAFLDAIRHVIRLTLETHESKSLIDTQVLEKMIDDDGIDAWLLLKEELTKMFQKIKGELGELSEKEIEEIIEFEHFTDSKLANVIINLALMYMAIEKAKKHKEVSTLKRYKQFVNRVFFLRFTTQEGGPKKWQEIAVIIQKEYPDIKLGKSTSAVHNLFTSFRRIIIGFSRTHKLNLHIEESQQSLTGKM